MKRGVSEHGVELALGFGVVGEEEAVREHDVLVESSKVIAVIAESHVVE